MTEGPRTITLEAADREAVELRHDNGPFAFTLPAYRAAPPSCSSMRSSWLYLAVRSDLARLPVLIWPQPSATAKSAMVESSVSPERWLITAV